MVFEDIVAVLERAFKLELQVVQGTTVFEVSSEDGSLNISCKATQENFSMMMLFGGTSDGEGTVPSKKT